MIDGLDAADQRVANVGAADLALTSCPNSDIRRDLF
jgi:hypothetical protein